MTKTNCSTCANFMSPDMCTRMMDTSLAQYKQCEGWKDKVLVKHVSMMTRTREDLSQRENRMLDKIDVGTRFTRFLNKGGHWSARTGEYVGVNEG